MKHKTHQKVHKLLFSKEWDTRIAAGQAIASICAQVPEWKPNAVSETQEFKRDAHLYSYKVGSERDERDVLSFAKFDILKVLQSDNFLLSSEGKVYKTI